MKKKKILVINTRKNISKWDFECFVECKSKNGNYFLRELKYPASHYFDSEEQLEEALRRG